MSPMFLNEKPSWGVGEGERKGGEGDRLADAFQRGERSVHGQSMKSLWKKENFENKALT